MKNKKIITTLLTIYIIFTLISTFEVSTFAATVYPNKYTYIRNSPYWFVSVVDQFSTSQAVTPIEREGDYVYIEYTKNNVKKRGYMPLADLSNISISWCNHTEFNPGKNITNSSIPVYYGPDNQVYGTITTLSSNAGIASNNPLLILGYQGNYARIQFVTNSGETAYNVQPQYCRGWVLKSQIEAVRPSASSYLGTSVIAMIKNVSTNKYLTVVETTATSTGYRVITNDSTGMSNQHWRITKYVHSSGGVYYKIISVSTGLCLQVQDALPMSYNLIELETPGDPDKSQEFQMSEVSDSIYNNVTVGKKYNIKTRMTGSYQCLDVSDENAVELRINGGTSQEWSVERFDKYWDKIYTDLQKSGITYNLKYYINRENGVEDVYQYANIYDSDIETSVNKWNIKDSLQNSYMNVSRTNTKSEAKIIIHAEDIGSAATARCMPAIMYNGVETQGSNYVNQDWIKSYVQLNSNSAYSGSFANLKSYDAKEGVVCHEFGHALKLKHPYGQLNTTTYADQVVYSVMNQGVYMASDGGSTYSKVQYEPTIFDKQNLLNKWSNS